MSKILPGLAQLFGGVLQVAFYGLLIFWSFKFVEALPWEKWVKKVKFYHLLLPTLILSSYVYTASKFLFDLLISFFSIFSKSWLFSFFSFAEGVGITWLLFKLTKPYRDCGKSSTE
ncbi:MAG: hypothetical protein Q8N84_00670 [bacterium]|nr:hypothetical protein [bacterium]